MNIRNMAQSDLEELKVIYNAFYKDKIEEFPSFEKFLATFVSVNNNGKIVIGGGVKVFGEAVLLTDTLFPTRDRREALLQMLYASIASCSRAGISQLHAFIEDENWYNQLKRYGFKDCKGKAIYLNI